MVSLSKSVLFAVYVALASSLTLASTLPPSATTLPTTNTTLHTTNTTTTTLPTNTNITLPTTTTQQEETTPTTTTTIPTTQESVTDGNVTSNTTSTTTTTTSTTSTTTPMPQPPYLCHDCNSGSPFAGMWHNDQCDEEGSVHPSHPPTACSTFCFSTVGLYPAGTVFRGCASALYLGEGEVGAGCFDHPASNRRVCLCAGHLCNTHNLTQHSDLYAQQYLDMQLAVASANTVN